MDPAWEAAIDWAGLRAARPKGEGRAHRPGSAWVLGPGGGQLARALAAVGARTRRWSRLACGEYVPEPWPARDLAREAWALLPRSGAEAKMLLHIAAARTLPGGLIFLAGRTRCGIRSAGRRFPRGVGPPVTVLVRRRCRVLRARRESAPLACLGPRLWRSEIELDFGRGPRRWISYPGIFAHGRLDEGTRLLIERLPKIFPGARALDYGAGAGQIAAAVLERQPKARVTMVEPDVLAARAAAENVPGARTVLGASIEAAAKHGPYDFVLSNPPIHLEGRQRLDVARDLWRRAGALLNRRGSLIVVSQRRFAPESGALALFHRVETLGDRGPHRVWRARAPRQPRA